MLDDHAIIYIEDFFKRMNRKMTENNKKQALVLEGCTVLENKHGMAPGMLLTTEVHSYMLFLVHQKKWSQCSNLKQNHSTKAFT